MTERTPPAWLQAGSHPADLDRLLIETLIPTAGVRDVAGGELAVTEQSTPAMGVTIAAGYVIIDGTESTSQGHYGAYNDGAVDRAIAASDPSNPRIDLVVARVYDSFYGVAASDTWALEVVTGTAEASPSEPDVPDNAEVLARVDVPAGASAITNANITDRRARAQLSTDLAIARPYTIRNKSAANQTVPTNSARDVSYDATEDEHDPDGFFTWAGDDASVTINREGVYQVEAGIEWGSSAAYTRMMNIDHNGARAASTTAEQAWRDSLSRTLVCDAGDTVKASCFHLKGSDDTIQADRRTFFVVRYVGPSA